MEMQHSSKTASKFRDPIPLGTQGGARVKTRGNEIPGFRTGLIS